MSQQSVQGKIETRQALLIFCKDTASPMVLYFDNPQQIYEDLKNLINSNEVKLVEFEPVGPIKKAALTSDKIVAVALQEEQYMVQQ